MWISDARERCVRGSEFCMGFATWKEKQLRGAKGKFSTSFVFGGNVPLVCHWSECELQVLRDTKNSVTLEIGTLVAALTSSPTEHCLVT